MELYEIETLTDSAQLRSRILSQNDAVDCDKLWSYSQKWLIQTVFIKYISV